MDAGDSVLVEALFQDECCLVTVLIQHCGNVSLISELFLQGEIKKAAIWKFLVKF